jgi:hypothetical protein
MVIVGRAIGKDMEVRVRMKDDLITSVKIK